MDRRTFLSTALGAAATTALAGCSTAVAEVPPPNIPEKRLRDGGWHRTGESDEVVFDRTYAGVRVTATQHTLQYADRALREEIRERTLGAVDSPLAVFFATRVDFTPDLDGLPMGIGRDQLLSTVEESAKGQFERQLESAGLQNIRERDTGTLTVNTGERADLTRYAAEFPFQGFEVQVTEDRSVSLEGGSFTVAGRIAVWHHGDYVLIAGGANPAQNFARTETEQLSDGIAVTVDIDLGLAPEEYRSEVLGLIKRVR